jgi:hypothetical protein
MGDIESFGKDVLEMVKDCLRLGEFDVEVEGLAECAERHGLMKRAKYDPHEHGEITECDPGDMVWYWGDKS